MKETKYCEVYKAVSIMDDEYYSSIEKIKVKSKMREEIRFALYKVIFMVRAAFYGRFSSNNQREESIDSQYRAAKQFVEARGDEIVAQYADKAKSGTTAKRPEFLRMVKDAESEKFDYVVVHKLDRFSRDKYDSAIFKRKLKQCGVRLISVTENLDGSPESLILESVQLIFKMTIDGYSRGEIIKELNERGFKTKLGTVFRPNSIHSILTNEKYTGVYVYNKTASKDTFGKRNGHAIKDENEIIRVEGGMPQIVSKDDFQKVQEILKIRKQKPGANKAKENYLLTGIIKCGCCGRPYQGNRRLRKDKPLYVSYRCSLRKKSMTGECDNTETRKEYVEEYVLSELERKIFNDEAIAYLTKGINDNIRSQELIDDDKKVILLKESNEIESQITNIVNAISQGFVQEEFKKKLDELKKRKSDIEIKLSEIESREVNKVITEADVRVLLSDFSGYVISRNIPECKKFIRNFVKEVIVFKDHIEVTFNVAFSLLKNRKGAVEVISSIKRFDLFESFHIKVS